MKKYLITILVVLIAINIYAQPNMSANKEVRKEKIENIKIGMLTNAMSLTSEQAEKFWPVYNRYNAEQKKLRVQRRNLVQTAQAENASEVSVQKALNDIADSKQQELDLQKKYQADFLKVISAKQLIDMYAAEKRFQQELVKRVMNKRSKRIKMQNP